MKKISSVFAVLGLLILSACQSFEERQAAYNTQLNQWVGAPESTLIANWGAPTNFYDSQGSRYITYRTTKVETSSTPVNCYPSTFNGWYSNCYGGDVRTSQSFCQVTFEIRGGVVRRAFYSGDGCF